MLPVDSMPVADIEHAGVIGFDVGMKCGHHRLDRLPLWRGDPKSGFATDDYRNLRCSASAPGLPVRARRLVGELNVRFPSGRWVSFRLSRAAAPNGGRPPFRKTWKDEVIP